MTDGIRGTARDGRLPSIRLRPVDDGTTRHRDEIGATNIPIGVRVMEYDYSNDRDRVMPNRATLATERKTVEPSHADNMAPRVFGRRGNVWIESKITMAGGEYKPRAIRTTDMGDDPLPSVPKIEKPVKIAKSANKSAARRVTRTASDRNATVDSFIRNATGYTGPITTDMRRAARDAMAHAAGVAAYAADKS